MLKKLSIAIVLLFVLAFIGSMPALAAPAGNESFITAPATADVGIRANYEGYSGYRFTALADIKVTALGRADVIQEYPMEANHDLTLWDVEKNKIIAKVTVKPISAMEAGYRYENLSTPVKLLKDKEYTLVSAEVNGGDYWLVDHDMTGTHTNVAKGLKAITGSGFLDNEKQPHWMPYEDGNYNNPEDYGFVGLNFWYEGQGGGTPKASEATTPSKAPSEEATPSVNAAPSEEAAPSKTSVAQTSSKTVNNTELDEDDEDDGEANPFIIIGICVGSIVIACVVFIIIRSKQVKDEKGESDEKDEPKE